MSIVFNDPVSPNPLPSSDETLDFSVTTNPDELVVSLRYPSGRMETVYQAGVVGAQFVVERDGSDFHISRRGGWPAGPFQLVYTESGSGGGGEAPVPSDWHLLYSIDFTAQPSYRDPVEGYLHSVVLEGKTWYFLGSNADDTTNMTGVIDAGGAGWDVNVGYAGSVGNISGGETIEYPAMFFPLSQTDYDPNVSTCVRVRPPSNTGCAVGIVSVPDGFVEGTGGWGAYHNAAHRGSDAFVARYGNSSRVSGAFGLGAPSITIGTPTNNGKNGMAVFQFTGANNAHMVAGTDAPSWTGFLPDPADMQLLDENDGWSKRAVALPRTNPCIMLMAYGPGAPGIGIRIPVLEIWQYYP